VDPQVRYLDGYWEIFSTRVYGLAGVTVLVNTFGLVLHAFRAKSEQWCKSRGRVEADVDSVMGSGRLNDLAPADFNLPFAIKTSLNFYGLL
jgi:hypothetical protein